jgi:hypothetical protein
MQEISGKSCIEAESNLNRSVKDINFLIAVGGDGLMNIGSPRGLWKEFHSICSSCLARAMTSREITFINCRMKTLFWINLKDLKASTLM